MTEPRLKSGIGRAPLLLAGAALCAAAMWWGYTYACPSNNVTIHNRSSVALQGIEVSFAGSNIDIASLDIGQTASVSRRLVGEGSIELSYTMNGRPSRHQFGYVTACLGSDCDVVVTDEEVRICIDKGQVD